MMRRIVLQVIRLARPIRHSPGFAIAVLLILALGIGANTATLNLLYGYLLAPLPYPHADRLVNVYFTSHAVPGNLGMSYPTYFDLRAQTTAMAEAGMYQSESLNLVAGTRAVHARGAAVSASLFTTLGVRPLLGRVFGAHANQPGAAGAVVLSYRLWSQLFDRNPAALGRSLMLDDTAYTVIGVMPANFQFPDSDTDLWLPEVFTPARYSAHNLTSWNYVMIARLAPGMSAAQLDIQSRAVLEREIVHFPDPSAVPFFRKLGPSIEVSPLRNALVGALEGRLILAELATFMLLLLVWLNLANLFIARALKRRGELIVRRVLGAETRALFRELFAQSLAPCLLGGVAGLLLGELLLRVLLVSGFGSSTVAFPLRDWGVVAGIALLLALLSALVFSLAGLYFIRRQDLAQALREADARSAGGRGEHRVRAALLIVQLALASALIGTGALLGRSLLRLDALALGFQPQHVLTFQVQIPINAGAAPSGLVARLAALQGVLARVPGVTAATVGSDVPFDGPSSGVIAFQYPFDGRHTPDVDPVVADSSYFRTLGIPLLAGRGFESDDAVSDQGSAVIDVQAARELFGTTNVVGRQFNFDRANDSDPGLLFRIIGVAAHTRHVHVAGGDNRGVIYLDRDQAVHPGRGWSWVSPSWYVAVRTPLEAAAILPALRQAVGSVLPGVPVYDVHSMDQRLAGDLAPRRGLAALVAIFALGALAVAAVGLYALQSYAVGQRRPELGVRAALGADGGRLRGLILREVVVLLAIGLAAGLCGVVVLGRALAAELYGVNAADPLSLALVLVVLSATALLAGWIPAQRASQVPPMEALRDR